MHFSKYKYLFLLIICLILLTGLISTKNAFASSINWSGQFPIPKILYWFGSTVDTSGNIYVIGGYDNSRAYSTVYEYNPSTNSWAVKASLPQPTQELAAVTGKDGKIYAIGGVSNGSVSSNLEIYDPSTNTWTVGPSMPVARARLGAVVESNGDIYVVGGFDSDVDPSNTVEIYDPSTGIWTMGNSMNIARYGLSVVRDISGNIYAIGGKDSNNVIQQDVEQYSPLTGIWTTEASIPTAIRDAGAVYGSDGNIYVLGGISTINFGGSLSIVQVYNSSSNTWSTSTSMPAAAAGLGTVISGGNIYALGGVGSSGAPQNNNQEGVLVILTPTPTPTPIVAINAGGDSEGNYVADTDYKGGTTYSTTDSVDTSSVDNPAPGAVYQTVRYGNSFSYTIPNLTANGTYTVRLHFNELYWNAAGQRVFNVAINGTQDLANFDIYQTAGGKDKAIVEQFPAIADSNGNITIQFTSVTDNAMVNGIEVSIGSLPTQTPTPSPTPLQTAHINAGGPTVGDYQADNGYTGGTTYSTTASIDTSNVTEPAPQSVYQTVRYGNFSYTIPTYSPDTNYTVRLDFSEPYFNSAGSRLFNVTINGIQDLSNFDVYQAAGGENKAISETFTTTTDSNGLIHIQFDTVTDNAMVSGIQVSQQ